MKTANTHWAGQQKIKIRFSTYKYRFRVESLFICFVLFCFVFDLLPSAFLAFFAAVDDRCCLHGRVSRSGVCGRDQDIAGGPPVAPAGTNFISAPCNWEQGSKCDHIQLGSGCGWDKDARMERPKVRTTDRNFRECSPL